MHESKVLEKKIELLRPRAAAVENWAGPAGGVQRLARYPRRGCTHSVGYPIRPTN
jgi:hypothetical protein